jgi:CubicO group peptidase (beta-lactamase class C family)
MDSSILDDFVKADAEHGLGSYGICLERAGEPLLEHRFRSDDRVNLYSVSKTFTSLALGLAEAEGRLSLDDRLLDHFPELGATAAEGVAQTTLRHWLTMTSGSGHVWFANQRITAPDLLSEIVATPLQAPPGTRFQYTGSGPYALGRVIAQVTGADLRAYLKPRLFDPLDLHNPAWHTCPLGYPFAESDLFLKTSELARLGRLLLQEGEWEGRQIVPAEYLRRMPLEKVDSTPAASHGAQFGFGYGLGVWLRSDGTYRADGAYGQYVVVSPERQAVVTVTAHSERDGELLEAIHELVLDRL